MTEEVHLPSSAVVRIADHFQLLDPYPSSAVVEEDKRLQAPVAGTAELVYHLVDLAVALVGLAFPSCLAIVVLLAAA